MEKSESLSLIRQRPSPKADRIFSAITEGWPEAEINAQGKDRYVLWGLIGNNQEYMRAPYIFCDMPYYGRLYEENYDESYWRWCYDGLHDNRKLDVPSDRFESWNVDIKDYKTDGEYILICPSSNTMTLMQYGIGAQEWVARVSLEIRKHTNKPIKVRLKPRKNGKSGPEVAAVPLQTDLENAAALVTSASLTATEALLAGVPVFGNEFTPTAWCTNRDITKINNPEYYDREQLFYNLAYKQYTIEEMRSGLLYENSHRYLNNQSR